MRFSLFSIVLFIVLAVSSQEKKPNVILIMGDDMGFSDLGCFGSEVSTPNLDMLAENGVRFRQFYNMAKCAPSRASLLTGQNAGNKSAISIAEAMNEGGYRTIMCGKQHTEDWMGSHTYVQNSFNRSLYHKGNEFFIPSSGRMVRPFYVNGKKTKVHNLICQKESVFYKPDVMTDYALNWMSEAKSQDKPFFVYMAYHVAHYPLQARQEDIDKYRDIYRAGWDEIREARFEKMKSLGIIDDKYKLTKPLDNIHPYFAGTKHSIKKNIPLYRPWDSLTDKEKDDLSLEMAVYSAMIDRMDQNIGRLIDWLKENGEYENTAIMYISDNGASPYDANHGFDLPPGVPDSFRSLSTPWANVANTPFKYYKQYGHEGGSNTHFIFHWPGITKEGEIMDGPGHITDLFPTVLDVTGVAYPSELHNRKTMPLQGVSLLPTVLNGESVKHDFFYSGFRKLMRSYRVEEWKIVRAMNSDWELYNMKADPSEVENLAKVYPEKVQELVDAYKETEAKYDEYWDMK